jgi:hypothetical protein
MLEKLDGLPPLMVPGSSELSASSSGSSTDLSFHQASVMESLRLRLRTRLTGERVDSESSKLDPDVRDTYLHRYQIAKNRKMWEQTLPKATTILDGQIVAGYNYDYIGHGASSRRRPEHFLTEPQRKPLRFPMREGNTKKARHVRLISR